MILTDYQVGEISWRVFQGTPVGMRSMQPFYWTRAADPRSAPSGWYRQTAAGLVYLGESILEEA